ncbi:hypothetical protein JCM17823_01660 [Halorubrum gandharaense]
MLPTHAVVGLLLGLPLAALNPELAPVALWAALLGGVVPDLDLYAGHRRTLHYPTGYALAALPAGVAALLAPSSAVALAAIAFLLGATAHCRMDRYGGGLELRPWEGTSERAVYDHVLGRWRRPKRWVRYDGSPGDLLLCGVAAAPLLLLLDGLLWVVVAGALGVAILYVTLRRWLAALAPTVFGALPEPVREHVPERYVE